MEGPCSSPVSAEPAPARSELRVTQADGPSLIFEFEPGPFEISPGLARVLLRIMRKAAERRGIDIDDNDRHEDLAS